MSAIQIVALNDWWGQGWPAVLLATGMFALAALVLQTRGR